MARKCELSKKKMLFGNRRSHSLNATRHQFNVNLITLKLVINGKKRKVKIAARTFRTLKKNNFKI